MLFKILEQHINTYTSSSQRKGHEVAQHIQTFTKGSFLHVYDNQENTHHRSFLSFSLLFQEKIQREIRQKNQTNKATGKKSYRKREKGDQEMVITLGAEETVWALGSES